MLAKQEGMRRSVRHRCPPIQVDDDMAGKLAGASRALGRLDGATEILPNADLFVYMYVRKEAVLSSQIEGTQASLIDILEHEADESNETLDVKEVVNYIKAMDFGLEWIQEKPIALPLIERLHTILLSAGRGSDRKPGQFRDVQNWIGPKQGGIRAAVFVPPPPGEALREALTDFERFLQAPTSLPVLFTAGIIHAQFETIHPFVDGNGRIGRLLLTLLLCQRAVISRPLLYVSYFFKLRRLEYYDRLQAIRDHGDWEGWMRFFLTGLAFVADEATSIARQITDRRETDRRTIIAKLGRLSGRALELHDKLFQRPIVTVQTVEQLLGVSYQYANRLVSNLEGIGLLREITGQRRNRRFGYGAYLDLLTADET
jgi:Fic family protein